MSAFGLLVLLLQAYDPMFGTPPPPKPAAPAQPTTVATGGTGYAAKPASYPWPRLWPANYNTNWRGRSAYTPDHLTLPQPTPEELKEDRAYYAFAVQKIDYGMDVPGHRAEEYKDFGPGGISGRVGQLKMGEFDTWRGQIKKPHLTMVPYDGRFEVVGEHPVGQFTCKQVKFSMSRGKQSVSSMDLFCLGTDGKWDWVT